MSRFLRFVSSLTVSLLLCVSLSRAADTGTVGAATSPSSVAPISETNSTPALPVPQPEPVASSTDPELPVGFPPERYEAMWKRSPFTLETPSQEAPKTFVDIVLVASYGSGAGQFAVLRKKGDQKTITVGTKPSASGIELISLERNDLGRVVAANLKKGSENGRVTYDPAQVPPPPKPGDKTPGKPAINAANKAPAEPPGLGSKQQKLNATLIRDAAQGKIIQPQGLPEGTDDASDKQPPGFPGGPGGPMRTKPDPEKEIRRQGVIPGPAKANPNDTTPVVKPPEPPFTSETIPFPPAQQR